MQLYGFPCASLTNNRAIGEMRRRHDRNISRKQQFRINRLSHTNGGVKYNAHKIVERENVEIFPPFPPIAIPRKFNRRLPLVPASNTS